MTMPTTTTQQKRARKSLAPLRPPIVPPPATSSSSPDGTVCHLCGYLGRTQSLSIEKNAYGFLRQLPPAPGAPSVHANAQHVLACHLCVLLLEQQRQLNRTSSNFFFKGFSRSTGSCNATPVAPASKSSGSPTELQESSLAEQRAESEVSTERSASPPPPTIRETISKPPPLRKATLSVDTFPLDSPPCDHHISSLDSFIASVRSRFLSEYTSLLASTERPAFDSCQLCRSIKPRGTLYTLTKSQFDFIPSAEIDVCTLCYYNLLDQSNRHVDRYRRPRAQCFVCRCRITFTDWEVKLLETEHLPFLLTLHDELYDNQRLALACDQCFYSLLFQYIDQQRQNIPVPQRTYSWQCTYTFESEHDENFYSSSSSSS